MIAPADRVEPVPAEILPGRSVVSPFVFGPGEGAFSAGESPSSGPSPAMFLHALRRQWLVGGLLGLCLAAAVAVPIWFFLPESYTSTAYLRVAASDPPLIFTTADRAGSGPDFKTYVATKQQTLLTPMVLEAALRDEDVAKLPKVRDHAAPIEWLQKELQLKSDAEIMKISLADSDPATAKTVLNGVVRAFLAEVVQDEDNLRKNRLKELEGFRSTIEEKVRSKRDGLRSLADNLGTSDSESLSLAQQGVIQRLGLVQNQLWSVKLALLEAKGELGIRQQAAGSSGGGQPDEAALRDRELDRALAVDPTAVGISREIERSRSGIADIQKRLSPNAAAPYVAKFEAQIQDAERRLAERRALLEEQLKQQVPATDGLAGLALKVSLLEQQESQLGQEVATLETAANKFRRPSIDVEMMRAEVTSLDSILSQISQEIERTKVELGGKSRIQPFGREDDWATTPVPADAKKRAAMTGFAAIAGLCLPIALLVWRDASRRRVDGTETVTGVLRLEVLGVVPRIPQRTMKRLAGPSSAAGRWRDRLFESINAVATMVAHKAEVEEKRVIVISSAVAGEGKTTLAGQLAARLGELGHRTLLVDFDLRRPTLHDAFDVPLGIGMSDLLDGAAELSDAVRETGRPNLSLITAGSREPNVLRSTSKGLMGDFFAAVRHEYEFVIVDSSPVLPVVDTRLIAQFGDGVILSLLKDVSESPKVSAALAQLNSYGVAVFGTVVTGCSQDVYYGSRRVASMGV